MATPQKPPPPVLVRAMACRRFSFSPDNVGTADKAIVETSRYSIEASTVSLFFESNPSASWAEFGLLCCENSRMAVQDGW
jgi:hypothetical protein